MYSPHWGQSHLADIVRAVAGETDAVDEVWALAREVNELATQVQGLLLTPDQRDAAEAARREQTGARDALLAGDLEACHARMAEALTHYRRARPYPLTTLWQDDFESGATGWTHGGEADDWELGSPVVGPAGAHSGSSCWGTNLLGDYQCHANSWLLSPRLDLTDLASAFFGFWVYNQVDDRNQGLVYDPLWLDITVDGDTFEPLCSDMGGGNDDPEIPEVGGWSRLVLDLTPYVGHDSVRVRFRFSSDGSGAQAGAYVDDVQLTGRRFGAAGTPRSPAGRLP
jgi:hypothetical protein